MKTWNKELKAHWMPIFESHHAADRYTQGDWITEEKDEEGMHRGCAFGCSLQIDDYVLGEAQKQMQLPGWLVYLIERIFEGLPKKEAPDFFLDVMRAIPCDADIDSAKHAIATKRLTPLLETNSSFQEEIQAVIDFHKNWKTCKGDEREKLQRAVEKVESGPRNRASWSAHCSAAGDPWLYAQSAVHAVDSYDIELRDEAWSREASNLIEELNNAKDI